MSENATNKNLKSIKIPRDVHRKIKAESNDTGETIETVASRIFESHFSIVNSGDSNITKKSAGLDTERNASTVASVQSPTVKSDVLQVSESDEPWVRKLLQVLHSAKPGLPLAIQNNMNEFAWADEAWNELKGLKSPLVSTSAAGAGGRRAAPGELTPITRPGGDRGGDRNRETRFTKRLDALEAADEHSQKGKKNAPGKTG